MNNKSNIVFKDPTSLAKKITFFGYIALAGCLLSLPSEWWNYLYLQDVLLQNFSSDSAALEALDLNDLQMGLVSILQLGIIPFYVFFFMLIYRFARNAKALKDQDPTIKPGWCVGWFFVPIASLWIPYQKIKKLMDFDAPYHTQESIKKDKNALRWFWTFDVFSQVTSGAFIKLTLKSQEVKDLILLSKVNMFASVLDLIFIVTTLHFVRRLVQLQKRAFEDREASLLGSAPIPSPSPEIAP